MSSCCDVVVGYVVGALNACLVTGKSESDDNEKLSI